MHRSTRSVSKHSTATRECELDLQNSRVTSASIVTRVVFCGQQNISLREHRDDDKLLEAASYSDQRCYAPGVESAHALRHVCQLFRFLNGCNFRRRAILDCYVYIGENLQIACLVCQHQSPVALPQITMSCTMFCNLYMNAKAINELSA